MGSGRGRERYGVAGRKAAVVVDSVASMVDGFDPDLVGGRDAFDLVAEFSRLEHLASAGLMLAARKVAQTDLWKRGGHSTPAHWLSHVTGVSVAEAVSLLETAEVVESAPDTREALSQGAVSVRQAKAIGRAENADPDAGKRLLASAPGLSTRETEKAANRIVAAASQESPAEKAQRHRAARRFRHGVTDDGMGWGQWLLPIAEHTRAVAAIEGEQRTVFDQNRVAGVREPVEAYAADALCRVLDRAARRGTPVGSDGASIDDTVEDWSFAKVIVKIDLAALDRGSIEPGEVCEIAGQGPIPVTDVWRMIDGNAFIAAVTTKGSEISKVVHLGRRPTALQRTALEALGDGCCDIEGCNSKARLEVDHVAEWAATERTELRELAKACGHHHDLKTHHGYTFGPRQPDGTRRLIPPRNLARPPSGVDPPHEIDRADETGDTGDTGDTGPPDLTLVGPPPPSTSHDGTPTATSPPTTGPTAPTGPTEHALPAPSSLEERARAIGRRGQGHLFDTG